MKRGLKIFIALVCAATVVLLSAYSARKDGEQPPAPQELPRLNEVLTDSLSDIPALYGMDAEMEKFMKRWELRGVSLSVMRNDSLLYSKGYGWADEEAGVEMTPSHILRMASVSKLITATAIMKLKEEGQLSLNDKVFGENGILDDSLYNSVIRDRRIYNITVEQLLRHKGGFTVHRGDPMFSTQDIIRQFRLDSAPDSRTLTRCELSRRLGFTPGTSQMYSNFGYLLLSLVIEKISGRDYESFVQENVLIPAGCFDMHIANNYYEERYPNEVKYYMQTGSEPCEDFHLNGDTVVRCYGGRDVRGLSGAGAWCGSTAELCRFAASIDGREGVPDIISRKSVEEMTAYVDSCTFSLGWNDTKASGEWTRTGTLSGSSALIKYYPDRECWIMISNTGTYRGPYFSKYTSSLFRRMRAKYSPVLPKRDLFRHPQLNLESIQ